MARPLFAALAAAVLSTVAFAQEPKAPPPDAPVDAATRSRVIDEAIEALQKSYVFPEVAAKMADDVRARQARGEYESLGQSRAFARALTEHFQAVSRDKHLRVVFGGPAAGRAACASWRATSAFSCRPGARSARSPGRIGKDPVSRRM